MFASLWALLKGLIGWGSAAEKVVGEVHDARVESAGVAKQVAADAAANVEASEHAAVISEGNAGLDRGRLVGKLRAQTGVDP